MVVGAGFGIEEHKRPGTKPPAFFNVQTKGDYMPIRRPCIDCGQPIPRHLTRCATCTTTHEQARGTSAQRGYDHQWRTIRQHVLDRDRHRCQLNRPGCLGHATTVDHVQPLAKGGARLDPDNLQAACSPCNSGKRDRWQGVEKDGGAEIFPPNDPTRPGPSGGLPTFA